MPPSDILLHELDVDVAFELMAKGPLIVTLAVAIHSFASVTVTA
jgi:hypothetical protein